MIQRPPRSPRTYTLFPYTTLFRSLQQVFINLISNAIRHNDSTAPAIWVEGGAGRDGMTVEIRVRDNGPGIPPEDRELLFGKFSRGWSGRRKHHGSSGLDRKSTRLNSSH